jgi:uncharacterized protein YjbI with pentapeptide repeats
MTDTQATDSPQKAALETRKLELETKQLAQQLSRRGQLQAWLQAASVPVALLGAILAFFIGYGELHETSEKQGADRIDAALAHLSSTRPEERLDGVAGLQLFVTGGEPVQQQEALQFLVNGLSVEPDARVRGAIVDILDDLHSGGWFGRGFPQAGLDGALRTAVERNRNLTAAIREGADRALLARQQKLLQGFGYSGADTDEVDGSVPEGTVEKLTPAQFMAFLGAYAAPFETLDLAQRASLDGLKRAIETLVRRGAALPSMSGIFCEYCNFGGAALNGARFDGAFLHGATFAHARLRGASFHRADLDSTNFFAADLAGADLTAPQPIWFPDHALAPEPPIVECANLAGADLTGFPLIYFSEVHGTSRAGMEVSVPRLAYNHIDATTRLNAIGMVLLAGISDEFIAKFPNDPATRRIVSMRSPDAQNTLTGAFGAASFRRRELDLGDAPETYTVSVSNASLGAGDLPHLGPMAFVLRGFVDQPELQALPLYASLVKQVNATPLPPGDAGKRADEMRAAARKDIAAQTPADCNRAPNGGTPTAISGDYELP